jgi:hypothetical protein
MIKVIQHCLREQLIYVCQAILILGRRLYFWKKTSFINTLIPFVSKSQRKLIKKYSSLLSSMQRQKSLIINKNNIKKLVSSQLLRQVVRLFARQLSQRVQT